MKVEVRRADHGYSNEKMEALYDEWMKAHPEYCNEQFSPDVSGHYQLKVKISEDGAAIHVCLVGFRITKITTIPFEVMLPQNRKTRRKMCLDAIAICFKITDKRSLYLRNPFLSPSGSIAPFALTLEDSCHTLYTLHQLSKKVSGADSSEHEEPNYEQLHKLYEEYKLTWMIEHGYTLADLIACMEVMIHEDSLDGKSTKLSNLFDAWEFGVGFCSGDIWPCFEEFCQTELTDTLPE